MQSIIEFLAESSGWIALQFTLLVIIFGALMAYRAWTGGPTPISHKIAVIGLQRTGKTTLITALFEYILKENKILRARLHGSNTINRINKNIARLGSGLEPTKEVDTFAFRFSYRRPLFNISSFSSVLDTLYDVEMADFPGEYSADISKDELLIEDKSEEQPQEKAHQDRRNKEYRNELDLIRIRFGRKEISAVEAQAEMDDLRARYSSAKPQIDFGYTLFKQEFFTWIASSREYLFLIDLSTIYSASNVRRAVADMSARIRTSWQIVEDATSERGIGSARHRKLHIVFTKADVASIIYNNNTNLRALLDAHQVGENGVVANPELTTVKESVKQRGEIKDLTIRIPDFRKEQLDTLVSENNEIFSDLIKFFKVRARAPNIIYSSMLLRDADDNRVGIPAVFDAVVP